jgi:ketosteroid isomerase-like protein
VSARPGASPPGRPAGGTAARPDDHVTAGIRELQRAFDDAERHADTGRLSALLADDFLSIGEQGFQLDKRQWIARHADFAYLSLETAELDIRCYDGAAIVRCVQHSRASWRGDAMTLAVRLSQVWVRRPDGWRLAGLQFSSRGPA